MDHKDKSALALYLLAFQRDISSGLLFTIARELTWENNPEWDDCVPIENRDLARQLLNETSEESRCPYLKERGTCFTYCSARTIDSFWSNTSDTDKPDFNSAEYQAYVEPSSLQWFCFGGRDRHEACITYQDAEKKTIERE